MAPVKGENLGVLLTLMFRKSSLLKSLNYPGKPFFWVGREANKAGFSGPLSIRFAESWDQYQSSSGRHDHGVDVGRYAAPGFRAAGCSG
ncbi:hypothetical protein SDC9_103386 [bioreactor metagenome]|uniref:Uncharacterized protein n=1 Tax=bioreactor metagenome TaxID=1076179 RepID=A0A645AU05_9ZZZZ